MIHPPCHIPTFNDTPSLWRTRLNEPHYSLKAFFLMLLPALILVSGVGFYSGFREESIYLQYQEMRSLYPSVTAIMQAASSYLLWPLYAIYVAVFVHATIKGNRNGRAFVARFIFSLIIVLIILTILKVSFGMSRPGISLASHPFSFKDDFASFPSGHTVRIVSAALPIAFYFSRLWISIAVASVIALVACSRLWLGMHYPLDALGGILVGSLIVFLMFNRFRENPL